MFLITPREYIARTNASYDEIAELCCVEPHTVRRWFIRGENRRTPSKTVCRVLALELQLRRYRGR